MKTRYKIPLIVGIAISFGFVIVVIAPVFLMIGFNFLSGFIMSNTADDIFEKDFAKIPEVKLFVEKYPNYTTDHLSDFLGWKIINYDAKLDTEKSIHLSVKKSVLHQGIKIHAGCNEGGFSFAFDIPQEQVMDYLNNDECLKK